MVNTFNPPASVLLSWPKPNYVNPDDQGPALFICCIALSVIGIFTVAARVYSRLFLTRAPGSDDVMIVLGSIFTVALSILIAYANHRFHSGRHVWDVPFTTYSGHRLNIWICQWIYLAASSCIKISILLFYRRLSVSFPKKFLWACWAGIAYNVLVFVGFAICLLSFCSPVKAYWLSWNLVWVSKNKFHCKPENVSLPLSGGLSVVGDFYATLLPMCMVYAIARSQRQKLGLYLLFGLGSLSVLAGCIRTYLMHRLINVDYDFLVPLYYMWIVTVIELWVAVFAASAPALKPFFRKFLVEPVTKAKSSGVRSTGMRSTNAKSSGPWNSTHPWSYASTDGDSKPVDIEKVGIAHGFPEKIQLGTHSNWVELQTSDEREPYEIAHRRYSRMISFPEERSPSMDEIAIAR